jgi:uncharacterized protein YlaN (UPF0358 family)
MSLDTEINDIISLKNLNEELLDKSYNLLSRIIHFSKKNNLSVEPETLALVSEVSKTLGKMHRLSTRNKHPNITPDDSTEPKILLE